MTVDWSGGAGGSGAGSWSGGAPQLGSNVAKRSSGFNLNPFHDVSRALSNAYHYVNPIGGVKRAAFGIGKMFVDPIYNTAESLGTGLAGGIEKIQGHDERAAQDFRDAASFGTGAAQNVTGDVSGLGMMFANLGSTIATPLGLGGQYNDVVHGGMRWVAQTANKDTGLPNAFSPEMAAEMESYRPQTVLAEARHGGLAGAVIDQAMPVAMLGGFVKGAAEGTAATASTAAAAAADAGDAAEAAAAETRATRATQVAGVAEQAAHPLRFVGIKTADFLKAVHEQAYPGISPETSGTADAATASAALMDLAQSAPDAALEPTRQALAAARAALAPETAAAEAFAAQAREAGVLPDLKIPERPGNTPSSVDDVTASLQRAADTARDGTRPTYIEDQTGKRLETPAPAWAVRIAQALPDSVNRVLAHLNGPLTGFRIRNVARDMTRYVEIAQNQARSDPAMRLGQAAAKLVLEHVPSLTADQVSHMIGEEINAQLNGTAFAQEFVRRTAQVADPATLAAMLKAARNGSEGIPHDVMNALPAEVQVQLKATIEQAVEEFRTNAVGRLNTLLSSRFGAHGLERALLAPDDAMPMSAEQVRMYNRAMSDFRRSAQLRTREPAEIAKNQTNLDAAVLGSVKADADVVKLQQEQGINESTVTSLHDGVPPGLRDVQATVDLIMRATLDGEGGTFDIAKGVERTVEGIAVGIANQFDVPLAEFQSNPQLLIDAITNPKDNVGGNYDAAALWSGPDAHFGTWVHAGPDGTPMVSGEVGIATHANEPLTTLQATVLGEAYGQEALWDPNANGGNGGEIFLSNDPNVQAVYSHYASDILDAASPLSKVARDMQQVIDDGGLQITTHEVSDELLNLMHWDLELSRVNSDHKTGDIFRTMAHDLGAETPRNTYLAQTVLRMSTDQLVDTGMLNLGMDKVNTALAWYYDSHDFIEQLYRGKQWPVADAVTGVQRDAADIFYDVLAVTSVMASPKQNFGRALMGFSNFDDMIRGNDDALAAAKSIVARAFEAEPPGTTRVEGLGTAAERNLGPDSKSGTAVAYRWLNTPEFRKLTEQTSMTTTPKYNVVDILTGRLNLETASNADFIQQYADWTGKRRAGSDVNLPRENVLRTAETFGFQGPGVQAYTAWVDRLNALADTRQRVRDLKNAGLGTKEAIAKVLEAHGGDVIRPSEFPDAEGAAKRSPEVSPEEFQRIASKGRDLLARPTVEPTFGDKWDEIKARGYDSVRPEVNDGWGGATFDARTGEPVAQGADEYAVTTKAPGNTTIELPQDATREQFDAAMEEARTRFSAELSREGAHLGVFRDASKNTLEIDPVTVVDNLDDANAISAASRSVGGAYHFKSGDGFFAPHVAEESKVGFDTQVALEKAYRSAKLEEAQLREDPEVKQAFEHALMEYQGSSLLAKLRSFADNLRNPATSLAVTLDSVMASGYGMDKTDFGKTDMYATKSNEVRESARTLGGKLGRDVKPHEVQALAWVTIKSEIGRQDWGRLLAHRDMALNDVDIFQESAAAGARVDPASFDPFGDWWNEELGNSTEALSVRQERAELQRRSKSRYFTSDERARLDELNAYVPGKTSQVWTTPDRGGVEGYTTATQFAETRHEIPYDAKLLAAKMDSFTDYVKQRKAWQEDIAAGNFDKVKREMIGYVEAWKRPIMGDAEGGSFAKVGRETANKPGDVAHEAVNRLQTARYVPQPDAAALHSSVAELEQRIHDNLRGATIVDPGPDGRYMVKLFQNADLGTLLHEHAHLLRQILPEEKMAEVRRLYPGIEGRFENLAQPELPDRLKAPGRRLVPNEPSRGGTLSVQRVAAEEQFVTDLTHYIRLKVAGGSVPAGMDALFGRVASLLEETYPDFLKTQAGRALPNDIVDFWDRMYNPEIVSPDVIHDPLSAQYVEPPKGVNVRKFRWESDAAFSQRARQYGEARARSVEVQRDLAQAKARAVKADVFVTKMRDILNGPTRTSELADKLANRATETLTRIDEQLDHPSASQVPPAWRPFYNAMLEIADIAKKDTTGATAEFLEEIPVTFSRVLQFAAELQFDPTHIPDMTWKQAQRWMFGHMSLTADLTEAGLRKERTGVLERQGLADRSLEALNAANIMATAELYRGRLVDFIEKHYMRVLRRGQAIPDGWIEWAPQKRAIILGRDAEGGTVATTDIQIVPKEVRRALDGMRKNYQAWPFRMLMKSTNFWKQLILTYSPAWYVKHFIGATSLATLEGVQVADWRTAIKQYKTDALPDAVKGRSIWGTIDEGGNKARTVIDRSLADVLHTEGVKAARDRLNSNLRNIVKTWDGLSRAAVIAMHLREGASPEFAITRAYEALGDFGNLTPFERDAVQAAMPFYAFQKAMFKILLRLPADHPMATGVIMQLGRMAEAQAMRNFGATPTSVIGAGVTPTGHLVANQKLNPLTDSWSLTTPEGIGAALNPFLRMFAQRALDAPVFNAQAGMGSYGQTVEHGDLFQQLQDLYTSSPVGTGLPGGGAFNLSRFLGAPKVYTHAQTEALKKRIARTLLAEKNVNDNGGFLALDAISSKGGG